MTLLEICQIYTDLVNTDSEIPDNEYCAKDLVGALRSKIKISQHIDGTNAH